MWFAAKPVDNLQITGRLYSLMNSVAFHPKQRLFCATCTNTNGLRLFRIDDDGKAAMVQEIRNPKAQLSGPQHAVFSPDGTMIIVANWNGENFTVYARGFLGRYSSKPLALTAFPEELAGYKPHGIEISPSGSLIAVAFGATLSQPAAIGLFGFNRDSGRTRLLSLVECKHLAGIPKGICFTADETMLLVTFSNTNGIGTYRIAAGSGVIDPNPVQIVCGAVAGLSRPEDIKLAPGGRCVVTTNSGANSLVFHAFDAAQHRITQDAPVHVMDDAVSAFSFPHGVCFSPDGEFMVVSHFGPLETTDDENILFSKATPVEFARITIYRRSAPTFFPPRPVDGG